jgi:hypothetical protein
MVAKPNQADGDNLKHLDTETNKISGKRGREYLKERINDLETNNKNKCK